MLYQLLTAAALASVALANKQCTNVTVPVQVSSRNGDFDIAVPQTDLDVTTFILNNTQQGRNFTDLVLRGYKTVEGLYNISAKYCAPEGDSYGNEPVVQVLTHGIGFDKTYWDLPYNNYNYSYIDRAIAAGYHTVAIDRLGIGNSSHGEPVNEIQAFLEVEALHAITQQLRNGSFPEVSHSFSKVVHVGHSFGSAQTYALASKYPSDSDGIALTGFSVNSSFIGFFAAGGNFVQARNNQPLRFGSLTGAQLQEAAGYLGVSTLIAPIELNQTFPNQNLPPGYIISSNAEANVYNFFYPGAYDLGLVPVAEATKQPVTIGELLTIGSIPMMNGFKGPVLVITGEFDVPFCGGNCLAGAQPSIPAGVQKAFAGASVFNATVVPNTGHGLNAHYSAPYTYAVINEFFDENVQ